ncbi:hypothetical protein KY360_00535 [Candidatus Woesearchaeota archaeon]|nr:hypothetical protein [Candidatus Woesearchaeota archaeon]
MNKKGIGWQFIVWMIIGLLVLGLLIYITVKSKGSFIEWGQTLKDTI